MDGSVVALLGIALLLALILMRVSVGLSMLIAGAAGIALIRPQAVLAVIAGETFTVSSRYTLIILPLFMLMGNLTVVSGMSRDLYLAANRWLGRIRGGLAAASVIASAGFSALSGSSLATALTMGRVALPEMRRFSYDKSLAAGTVAAGGTLGILIPPSAGLVFYGIMTEQSISRLFMAGLLPGILLTAIFVLTIVIIVTLRPDRAPRGDRTTSTELAERGRRPTGAYWILGLAAVTLGGIYAGVFSALEASGVGAFLTLLVALARRSLTRKTFAECLLSTLRACGTVFLILIGAYVFKVFLGYTQTPLALAAWIGEQGWSGPQVVAVVLAMFIVLGTILDAFAILVLTIPLVQPILTSLGVDMIWFGVMLVITLEMGLISPPVGLNTFVVKTVAPDIPMRSIFRGIIPFWFAMLALLVLLAFVPGLVTFLPQAMFG
ncbi:MAG: TRAP transporter large permease [Gemmatimonadota bacterium]|nr:TRAP transporter large permease [Gemmatimonadota bacterium]MDE2677288.1 TRAP transporter large permease [Gemmatimonadota bacterium]MXX33299.1 TRAP transporter large permease [Gemmatimonadota bacterium]MYD14373.1 TRAP transporter large permease [Gemmatimonadota bacterium]